MFQSFSESLLYGERLSIHTVLNYTNSVKRVHDWLVQHKKMSIISANFCEINEYFTHLQNNDFTKKSLSAASLACYKAAVIKFYFWLYLENLRSDIPNIHHIITPRIKYALPHSLTEAQILRLLH